MQKWCSWTKGLKQGTLEAPAIFVALVIEAFKTLISFALSLARFLLKFHIFFSFQSGSFPKIPNYNSKLFLFSVLTDWLCHKNGRWLVQLPIGVQVLVPARTGFRRRFDDTGFRPRAGRFGRERKRGVQELGLHCDERSCEEKEEQRFGLPVGFPAALLSGLGNLGGSDEPEERESSEGSPLLN